MSDPSKSAIITAPAPVSEESLAEQLLQEHKELEIDNSYCRRCMRSRLG